MVRAPCCDKNGLKKGPWTPEEDQKLIDYIQKHGYGNWRTLPKNAGLQRCGKSCRLRWTNYLRPDIKRGRFSFEEEETIIQLHSILGNKWSTIAARLPGRTDNEIKNFWNTHIRKRLLRMGIDPVTHSPRLDLLDLSSILNSSLYNSPHQMNISRFLGVQPPLVNPELLRIATSLAASSSRCENPNFDIQNCTQLENNQLCNNHPDQLQNQYQSMVQPNQFQTPIQEIPTCTTLTSPPCCVPFSNEAQVMDPNVEQYPSNVTDFGSQNSQDYATLPPENYSNFNYVYVPNQSAAAILDPSCEATSTFISHNNCNNNNNEDFSFASVLSTTSSSTTPLNSNNSNTYINSSSSTTEDERESHCSITNNMLRFEIPDFLDVSNFL